MANQRKPTATSRLMKDYARLQEDPVPYIVAEPNPRNILEWHYVVEGPENSPYVGGYYHGHLIFPPDYPFKPPSVYMLTPNGRFHTNKRLCLSISDFHPDTWNPAWSVSTILVGLLSFMLEDTATLGSIPSSLREKRRFACDSILYNLKHDVFRELFPTLSQKLFARLNDKQRHSLKEDLERRHCKLDLFPELKTLCVPEVLPEDTQGTSTCDSNDTNGSNDKPIANDEHNNNNFKLSTNILLLAMVLFGLILNYVLKASNFYD